MKKNTFNTSLKIFIFLILSLGSMHAYSDVTCNPTTVSSIKNDYRSGNTHITLADGTVIQMLTSMEGYKTNLAIALMAKSTGQQVQVVTMGSSCGTIIYQDFNYFSLL